MSEDKRSEIHERVQGLVEQEKPVLDKLAEGARPERRPITKRTSVEWECPWCHKGNGIPEVVVCKCYAKYEGDYASK